MKRMLRFFAHYKKETILAPLFKLLEALMNLLVPLFVAAIIDRGVAADQPSAIWKSFAGMIVLAVAGMLFSFTAQWFAAKASIGFTTEMRQALFDHIGKLSYSDLDRLGTDTLITRMTSDANQVQNGINLTLRLLLRSPFIVFGSMIMAFTIDVKSALIFAAAIPLLAAVVFAVMLGSIPLFRKSQQALDGLTGVTRENLSGVRVIRAFCREEGEVQKFDQKNASLTHINEVVGRLSALMNPLTYALINAATVVLIRTGAVRVSFGALSQGQVVALYNYMAQITIELIKFASLIITINKSLACADRIADVFDMQPGMTYPAPDAGTEEKRGGAPGSVRFEHVSFAYSGAGANALEDITFTASPGETIGVIGGTGSGKSTLVSLIPRFYDATEGTVQVGGRDVKSYPENTLISRIGMVPQKAVLFRGTIRSNLLWGNESADDEALWEAVRTAQAEEVVKGKEGMLDAPVEQNGRNLSGGQRQRLTIARALVRRPEILILDDSSSALDFATDLSLRRAIRRMKGGPTVFVVSQRISSIQDADRILVLDDGRLAGCGTHEELLENCRVYQEIYDSQYPGKRDSGAGKGAQR